MEECMKECMKKLALWHTPYFKPIMTHEELEPILTAMGFKGLPPSSTSKAYVYLGKISGTAVAAANRSLFPPPIPTLPYPKIDGLHVNTYCEFIDAVNYYFHMPNINDLFHVRGVPLHKTNDKSRKWIRVHEEDNTYVYRDGTLDGIAESNYNSGNCFNGHGYESLVMRDKGNNDPRVGQVIPLKDIASYYR